MSSKNGCTGLFAHKKNRLSRKFLLTSLHQKKNKQTLYMDSPLFLSSVELKITKQSWVLWILGTAWLRFLFCYSHRATSAKTRSSFSFKKKKENIHFSLSSLIVGQFKRTHGFLNQICYYSNPVWRLDEVKIALENDKASLFFQIPRDPVVEGLFSCRQCKRSALKTLLTQQLNSACKSIRLREALYTKEPFK